jgi:putative DNA primase/helicase
MQHNTESDQRNNQGTGEAVVREGGDAADERYRLGRFMPAEVCLADVVAKPIEWQWRGRIGKGMLNLIAGDPGVGKTTVTLDLAAHVTMGTPWPDDPTATRRDPGWVLLLGGEDGLADTVKPRLEAAGADCQRIVALPGKKRLNAKGEEVVEPLTLADVQMLEEMLKKYPDIEEVIIDPIGEFYGDKDQNGESDTREMLRRIRALAQKYNVAVIIVAHQNKATGSAAIHRVLGSIGLVGIVRSAWLVAKHPTDRNLRVFVPIKQNLAATTGLAFKLNTVGEVANIVWQEGEVTLTADEVLAAGHAHGDGEDSAGEDRRSAVAAAHDFLRDALADGPVESKELREQAKAAGVSWASIMRAKHRGAARHRKTQGVRGVFEWMLPADAQKALTEAEDPPLPGKLKELSDLRDLPGKLPSRSSHSIPRQGGQRRHDPDSKLNTSS